MKFCPECGTRLDANGYCKNCDETYGENSFVTNNSDYAEFLLFQNFEYKQHPEGGYILIRAKNKNVKKAIIPPTIKAIEPGCFYGCEKLVDVEFLGEMETIPDNAFGGCKSITFFTFPDGLKTIGESAFADTDLSIAFELPEGLEAIGNYAFKNAQLLSINLPSTLKLVGANAFEGVKGLGSVTVKDLKSYLSIDFTNELANPNYYAQDLSIDDDDTLLDEIRIPGGVYELRPYAFAGSMAEKVYIPSSVNKISPLAFINCDSIEQIKIHPDNYDYTVTADGITSKNGEQLVLAMRDEISKKIKVIQTGAFCSCSYRVEVRVENPNAALCEGALFNCNELEFYTGPLTRYYAGGCNTIADLFTLKINKSNWYGNLAFKTGTVPRSLSFLELTAGSVIDADTFGGIKELVSLVLPPDLQTIKCNAFENICVPCIIIPSSVTKIENLTRLDRSAIGSIKCAPGGHYKIVDGALLTADGKTMIASVSGKSIPSTVTMIEEQAFAYNEEIKSVRVEGSISTVKRNAFMRCRNLTTAYIGPRVMQFSAEMFSGCDSLKSVEVAKSNHRLEGDKQFGWEKETVFLSTPEINAQKIFNPKNPKYGMITRRSYM